MRGATPIGNGVMVAGGIIAAALGSKYLQSAGIVAAETATRVLHIAIGAALTVQGNYMPKRTAASQPRACGVEHSQPAVRAGAWAMTAAGLLYGTVWSLAPASVAEPASLVAVAAATAVTAACGLKLLVNG